MNFFLNKGFKAANSGVEHAELYRLRAFNELKEESRLVLTDLTPKLPEFLNSWQVDLRQVLNLYDYLMAEMPEEYLEHGLTKDQLVDFDETELTDSRKNVRLVVEQAQAGYLIKRLKDRYFDEQKQAYLLADSQIELIGSNRRLSWSYERVNGQKKMTAIHLENFDGKSHYFQSFEELLNFFMSRLQAFFGPSNYFIDRGMAYHEYFVQQDQRKSGNRVYAVIHANHRLSKMNSKAVFNPFYHYPMMHINSYDAMICSTRLQAETLREDLKELGLGEQVQKKVRTIPVGFVSPANHTKSSGEASAGTHLRLVTASRLHPEKHLDELILAMQVLHEKKLPATLTIYGTGSEQNALQKLVEKDGLHDIVHFAGLSKQLKEDLKDFDLYLSASYSEGFGLTYLEALGRGVPVLSYANYYGAQELVIDGKNGYVVPFSKNKDSSTKQQNANNMADTVIKASKNLNGLKNGIRESLKCFEENHVLDEWQSLLGERDES